MRIFIILNLLWVVGQIMVIALRLTNDGFSIKEYMKGELIGSYILMWVCFGFSYLILKLF